MCPKGLVLSGFSFLFVFSINEAVVVCVVTHIAKVRINRVRLPTLLVVS